jgi:hypothetical protein
LHRLYVAFGETTGPKHAAVWFHKGTNPDDIDAQHSTVYCERFNLKRSEAPFIIVTTVHPDESSRRPEVILAFGSLQAGTISKMILTLTDQIATEKLSQDEVNSVQYWQSWIRVIEGACKNLAKTKFSLTIKVLAIERTGLCGDTAS